MIKKLFKIAANNFTDPDKQLQLDWIKGLLEQIEFADRPEVLPDYVLHLDIRRRIKY
jgi:hypothetical protein